MNTAQLDTQAAEQLAVIAAQLTVGGPAASITAQRVATKKLIAEMTDESRHVFNGEITDLGIEGPGRSIPTRRYEPEGGRPGCGVVYFHGGGWVFGDLDTGDRFARALARVLRVTVVSVHYRRAPENVYPAALDDCVLVAEKARDEFQTWCAVAGDSAGGNLALATTLSAERRYDAQLLMYPCVDAEMAGASYQTYADGYGLTREIMKYYWEVYGGNAAPTDPLLSPLHATSLAGMPPTVLAVAGYDVLYDENQKLADRFVASGVDLTYLPSMSLPHGFIDFVDSVDASRVAVERMLLRLKSLVPVASGLEAIGSGA